MSNSTDKPTQVTIVEPIDWDYIGKLTKADHDKMSTEQQQKLSQWIHDNPYDKWRRKQRL